MAATGPTGGGKGRDTLVTPAPEIRGAALWPPEVERAYRDWHLHDDARVAAAFVAIVTFSFLLFGAGDFAFAPTRQVLAVVLAARAVFVLVGIAAIWSLLRTLRPVVLDRWAVAWSAAYALRIVFQAIRPVDHFLPLLADVAISMSLWLMFPARFPSQVMAAVLATAGTFAWLVAFRVPPPYDGWALIAAIWITSNGIAAYVSWSAHRQRRATYLDLLQLSEAEKAALERASTLATNERRQRNFLENLNAAVIVHALDTRIVQSNRMAGDLLGLTPDQMQGRVALDPGWRFLHEDGTTMAPRDYPVVRVLATNEPVVDQVIGVDRPPTGDRSWGLVNAYPEYDKGGNLRQVVVTIVDITRRRQAEEMLRISEERHRLLAENALDVVWTMGLDGKVTYVSPAVEKLRGFTVAEAMAQSLEETLAPGSQAVSLGYWAKLVADLDAGSPPERFRGELEYRCRDGSTVWTEVITLPVIGPDGAVKELLGVSRDLSERKQAEKVALDREAALRESESRFRALTNAAPVGVFHADAQGNAMFTNPAMERIMGLSAQEAEGKGWMKAVHPEDRDKVFQQWLGALDAGRDFTSEYRFLSPSGRVTWVRGYGSAVRDLAGDSTGYMAVVVDITDRLAMEQRLAVASRLAAMGTLVAGVAHEINNPLTGIMAGLGTAAGDVRRDLEALERGEQPSHEALVGKGQEFLEVLEDASDAAARITRIVKDLAVFGAPAQERVRLRLVDVVSGATRWLPPFVQGTASVRVEDHGAPEVTAARGQMEQVLVNLLTNAAKATRPGTKGAILVRIGTGSPGMARLEVVDHGAGIDPAILGKIFDPFFTTRPAGEGRGAGLGLAICHAIVADHGGTISVESEAGKGSTFRVELPAAPGET